MTRTSSSRPTSLRCSCPSDTACCCCRASRCRGTAQLREAGWVVCVCVGCGTGGAGGVGASEARRATQKRLQKHKGGSRSAPRVPPRAARRTVSAVGAHVRGCRRREQRQRRGRRQQQRRRAHRAGGSRAKDRAAEELATRPGRRAGQRPWADGRVYPAARRPRRGQRRAARGAACEARRGGHGAWQGEIS